MNKKNNQRFHETEIRMESTMLELMKDTEFEKITVKRICEKAKVNRSTFYAHFIDIYDMLDKMERELRKELLDSYGDKSEHQIFSEESFIQFLKHIKKHKYFYRINLQTRKSFPLKQGYEELWKIIKLRCEQAGVKADEEVMYYFINFQAGFTMVLKHWVDTDCKISEYAVAAIIKNCIPVVLARH
ncbi:TetR/AcrR family transcriptional regulator [Bacilliculturomica massiliensis]|uniref:TetR/AcrR family transcriptional regulator n=1 Tax=Bacilliculturomica massiliensis TaxID=1917867 RepID=UPI00102FB9D0|nr:TetR/AcrR family transcriptional regulator [Bacilliculturomica massiliensis]